MMEVAEVSRTKFDPYVIGNNIRDLREKRKMTQMKAAEEMDMSLFFLAHFMDLLKKCLLNPKFGRPLMSSMEFSLM